MSGGTGPVGGRLNVWAEMAEARWILMNVQFASARRGVGEGKGMCEILTMRYSCALLARRQ